MASDGGFVIRDYDGETAKMLVRTEDVTALSAAGILTGWGTLRSAIQGVILGVIAKENLDFFRSNLSNERATDANAQVERKWQVFYEGTEAELAVGIANPFYRQPFTVEIPTANLSGGRLLANQEEADLTETSMAALVTAFEGFYKDPAGKAVQILKIVAVGSRR